MIVWASAQDAAKTTLAVCIEVEEERRRQDDKWGVQNHNPPRWMLILGEEYGEAQRAVLEGETARSADAYQQHTAQYRKELVHTAAVAVAAIEALDRGCR